MSPGVHPNSGSHGGVVACHRPVNVYRHAFGETPNALQSVLAGRPTTIDGAQTVLIAGCFAWLVVFHLGPKADA